MHALGRKSEEALLSTAVDYVQRGIAGGYSLMPVSNIDLTYGWLGFRKKETNPATTTTYGFYFELDVIFVSISEGGGGGGKRFLPSI